MPYSCPVRQLTDGVRTRPPTGLRGQSGLAYRRLPRGPGLQPGAVLPSQTSHAMRGERPAHRPTQVPRPPHNAGSSRRHENSPAVPVPVRARASRFRRSRLGTSVIPNLGHDPRQRRDRYVRNVDRAQRTAVRAISPSFRPGTSWLAVASTDMIASSGRGLTHS